MLGTSHTIRQRRVRLGRGAPLPWALLWLALSTAALVPGTGSPAYGLDCGSPVWVAPATGVVIDPFRPPAHVGAPGNRGWEMDTAALAVVRAAAAGVVRFGGPVGGRLHVSISHCDGTRTTYSFLLSVAVSPGQRVEAGQPIALAADRFHFGAIRGGSYVDPATLLGVSGRATRARLVPVRGHVSVDSPSVGGFR